MGGRSVGSASRARHGRRSWGSTPHLTGNLLAVEDVAAAEDRRRASDESWASGVRRAARGPVRAARTRAARCGVDNDASGATLGQQVEEAYPRVEAIVRERPPAGTGVAAVATSTAVVRLYGRWR